MAATTFIGHFLGPGTHAARPAAAGLPEGTLYVCTTDSKIERVVSGAWVDYATLGSVETLAAAIVDAKGDLISASAADTPVRLAPLDETTATRVIAAVFRHTPWLAICRPTLFAMST